MKESLNTKVNISEEKCCLL